LRIFIRTLINPYSVVQTDPNIRLSQIFTRTSSPIMASPSKYERATPEQVLYPTIMSSGALNAANYTHNALAPSQAGLYKVKKAEPKAEPKAKVKSS